MKYFDPVVIAHPEVASTGICSRAALRRWEALGWSEVVPEVVETPEEPAFEVQHGELIQVSGPEWTAPSTSEKAATADADVDEEH